MRSLTMMGVEPAAPGRGAFQRTFDSGPQAAGRSRSALTPSRFGPRQAGQSSAAADPARISSRRLAVKLRGFVMVQDARPDLAAFDLLAVGVDVHAARALGIRLQAVDVD